MQSYTLSNGMHYVKRKNKNVTQFKRREIKKLDKKCDEPEINARKNFFAALTSAPALYGQLLHYHNHLNITITYHDCGRGDRDIDILHKFSEKTTETPSY